MNGHPAERFAGVRGVSFRTRGDLDVIMIDNGTARAEVLLLGAQIIDFRPTEGPPLIWRSRESVYQTGKPVRGGIPVCWPWFGDLERNPPAVRDSTAGRGGAHGFARNLDWTVTDLRDLGAEGTLLEFELLDSPDTRTLWPHPFRLKARWTLGPRLRIALTATHTGAHPVTTTGALHSYFAVSAIDKVQVHGLEGCPYVDTANGWVPGIQTGPLTVSAETDRIYQRTPDTLVVEDAGWRRRITIQTSGSSSAIVWNPWVEKARRLSTFADDEYTAMLCVETANALEDAVLLAPGASHTLGVQIRSDGF